MKHGYIRVAAATPEVVVADLQFNSDNIIKNIKEAHECGASLIVFPELSITSYTCGELFFQRTLINSAKEVLLQICEKTKDLSIISIVGLPIVYESSLMNCGAVIYKGEILGIIPKTYIPMGGYYESKFFKSALSVNNGYLNINGQDIPFGTDLIFSANNFPEFKFAVEIGQDLLAPNSPSIDYALSGASVICNLSASSELVSKPLYRRDLVRMHSAKLVSAYIYANSGSGESTQDLVFSGHNLICENGHVLKEKKRFESGIIYSDIDLNLLFTERLKLSSFKDNYKREIREISFNIEVREYDELLRHIDPHPFVPKDIDIRNRHIEEILSIQTEGLLKRLKHTNIRCVVLGLSGGLDSTLALLVVVRAFDKLNLPRQGIVAVTMPCFGTTDRTYNNSLELAKALGITLKEINIKDAVIQHFKDIGHDINVHDITYENSQARERTQILMDLANSLNALVIGTGDLSELALGWATYNGDHMSMYAVNASVPKTLIRPIINYIADKSNDDIRNVLMDIADTPISPELLPPEEGVISQKTENIVGPYELHDFYLFNILRYGFEPEKIFRLAKIAFKDIYDEATILKWMKVCYRRFFSQQFKRSCLPDSPKVGTVSLSPRGEFNMPSDASSKVWIDIIDKL